MRGIDTDKVCADGNDVFGGIKACLGQEACAASGGGCELLSPPPLPSSLPSNLLRACSNSRAILLTLLANTVNCGEDTEGFVHGGINVGLGCSGDMIKRCIDQNLGISGNTDYVCNTT